MVTLEGFGGLVQDFDWNVDGSLLATSSKDKMLRTWDPRTLASSGETVAHEGVKCFKLVWLGDSNNILTCGFTKQSKREFRIFDIRDLTYVHFVTPLFLAPPPTPLTVSLLCMMLVC